MIFKVAVPVNSASQAIALDFCATLLVAQIENGVIVSRAAVELNKPFPSLRAQRLKDLQVNTVLCGAVSDGLSMMLWHCGIEVIPGLTGDADQLIGAFIRGRLVRFHTPDFRPGFRRWRGGCGGGIRGRRFRGGRGGMPEMNNFL
jgi:predicted Fe-Mo cluster-binding NifX family protein